MTARSGRGSEGGFVQMPGGHLGVIGAYSQATAGTAVSLSSRFRPQT